MPWLAIRKASFKVPLLEQADLGHKGERTRWHRDTAIHHGASPTNEKCLKEVSQHPWVGKLAIALPLLRNQSSLDPATKRRIPKMKKNTEGLMTHLISFSNQGLHLLPGPLTIQVVKTTCIQKTGNKLTDCRRILKTFKRLFPTLLRSDRS